MKIHYGDKKNVSLLGFMDSQQPVVSGWASTLPLKTFIMFFLSLISPANQIFHMELMELYNTVEDITYILIFQQLHKIYT